jgi:hypothetical protein
MLHLTVWVAAIIMQSALLGRNMYAVSGHTFWTGSAPGALLKDTNVTYSVFTPTCHLL